MRQDAESFRIEATPEAWWDLWHYHSDWPGWGNRRWRYRSEHIRALATVFTKIIQRADAFATPFQAWIYLSGRDAGEDATYLHTPNGNKTPFPVALAGDINWGHQPLLRLFSRLLPNLPLRVGESKIFDQYAEPPRVVTSFFIYSPGVGVPLETAPPPVPSERAG